MMRSISSAPPCFFSDSKSSDDSSPQLRHTNTFIHSFTFIPIHTLSMLEMHGGKERAHLSPGKMGLLLRGSAWHSLIMPSISAKMQPTDLHNPTQPNITQPNITK